MWSWSVRIQPSEQRSFEYKATFALSGAGSESSGAKGSALEPRYLYAQGDLAVFLEDLGAGRREIGDLLERLDRGPSAEILVQIADEAMEILWPNRSVSF